jgi:hypothetical protein
MKDLPNPMSDASEFLVTVRDKLADTLHRATVASKTWLHNAHPDRRRTR